MDDEQILLALANVRALKAQGQAAKVPVGPLLPAVMADERKRLESSLYVFVQAAWDVIEPGKVFVGGKHIEAVCEHLEAVTRGDIKRLLINVPYRSTKSTVISVCWPAWEWAKAPSLQYLCFAHKQDNATRDTRRMRVLCKSEWYQSRWPLGFAKDQNLKQNFQNDDNGTRIAAGMTTGVMGANADRIIIDDPMDIEDTYSEVQSQAIFRHYDEEISRRLNSPGESAIVVCGQRVGHLDCFAHLLEETKDNWDHLVIPMRYESEHPWQRTTSIGWTDWRTEEGELMCPERFPEEYVQIEETKPGAAGQLQQRPSPRGGGMLKREWFEIVGASPAQAERVRAWDKAATAGGGAYTAGVLVARAKGVFYIEHVVREQTSPAARYQLLQQIAELDSAKHGYGVVEQSIEEEGGSAGKDAAWLERNLLSGHTVNCTRPTGSKEVRAQPFAAQAEAGNVKIVRGEWNQAFLEELATFPTGKFKDQTDATSAAFMRLATKERGMYTGDLACSGEDPVEEHRRFDDEELEELPEHLKELITETRAGAEDRIRWQS
jgi:predicted phage terminase large subunit-like protein